MTYHLTVLFFFQVLSVGNLSSPELSYQYVISLKTDKYKWHIDDVVPNHFCHSSYKLKHFRKCKKHLCSFVWKFSHWSEVSMFIYKNFVLFHVFSFLF